MKLKKDYCDKIDFLQQEYAKIAYELGSIEMQSMILKEDKEKLLKDYKEIQLTELELLSSIKNEYGEGEINLNTKTFISNGQ